MSWQPEQTNICLYIIKTTNLKNRSSCQLGRSNRKHEEDFRSEFKEVPNHSTVNELNSPITRQKIPDKIYKKKAKWGHIY